MILNYFFIRLLKLKKRVFLDTNDKKFIETFKKPTIFQTNKDIVIVELHEGNYAFVNTFLLLNNKKFKGKTIIGIWTFCLKKEFGLINNLKFFINVFIQYLIKKKWSKLYQSIGINKIYFFNDDFKNNYGINESNFVKKKLKIKKKEKILKIKYNKILVGDLIYDYYLRFFRKTTFQTDDIYSYKKILKYAQNIFERLSQIKKELGKNVKYYIAQQSAYLQHGIPLRFFLKNKIKSIGGIYNVNTYVKEFTLDWPYDSQNIKTLKSTFKKLDNKKEKIRLANQRLKNKFSGKKVAELFEIKNPYRTSKKRIEDIDLIIFLPGFDDAPHIYGNQVFNDFHEWIYETLNFLSKTDARVGIKPHPFTTWGSQVFTEEIKIKFSNFIWLDKKTSNKDIFKKKPIFGINPYGNVLHEMAYNKVIPISIGSNPHVSYNFVFTPKTKKQYFKLLKLGINKKLKLPKNYKKEILEWYYMYYIHNYDIFENLHRKLNLKSIRPADHDQDLNVLKMFNKKYIKILNKKNNLNI